MKNADDGKESVEDDLFTQKARKMFEESVDGLDAQAQSRLNRSRQMALEELGDGVSPARWSQWAPAAGAAAVAVVAVVVLSGNPKVDQIVIPAGSQVIGDFEILMADDSFEMLQDLEFYSWIDIDEVIESEPGANVG